MRCSGAGLPAVCCTSVHTALMSVCAGQWGNLFFLAHGSAREVAAAFEESQAGGLVLLGECLLPQATLQLPLLHEWTRWGSQAH